MIVFLSHYFLLTVAERKVDHTGIPIRSKSFPPAINASKRKRGKKSTLYSSYLVCSYHSLIKPCTKYNKKLHSYCDGHCNAHYNGHCDGHCNGHCDGHHDGHCDGHCNGHYNGLCDGHCNGHCDGHYDGHCNGDYDRNCDGNCDIIVMVIIGKGKGAGFKS